MSLLSIDAFTNVLLNVLFNAMENVDIYNIMHNDANTKHDHNVIVQTVSVTHTVKKFLIRLIVNGSEIFQITRQTDH